MLTYLSFGILIQIFLLILPVKALIGRLRPTKIEYVYRICNMRDLEHGMAMPSGDTYACAFFCGLYYYIFNAHWIIYLCVPMVALGRVYVHCHWIGDTIVGGIVGIISSYYWFGSPYFSIMAKPFIMILFKK